MPDGNELSRLIKFMGMTGSASDGEALAAVRMANKELATLNKTWNDLLRGKITIIADPFAGHTPVPRPSKPPTAPPRASPPPRPQPAPPPRRPKPFTPQPHTPPPPPRPAQRAGQSNKFAGRCIVCMCSVSAGDGFIEPRESDAGWKLFCAAHHKVFQSSPAPKAGPTMPKSASRDAKDIHDILF